MARISHITLPDNTDYSIQATGIFYGEVASTSTSTVFTATIPGITEYYDGLTILLRNGVVTSAANFTININGLGAKGSYSNMSLGNPITPTNPTRETTIFNINYAMLFVYNTTVVSEGCWICYRGYDANTNTIGYQIRTNSSSLPMTSITYRYRLLFTSADNAHFVPATNSTSTNATSARTVCQDKINPFGRIVYYGTTASVAAGSRPSASNLWDMYAFTLGYSFVVTLTAWEPVYLKCAPQSDGSAIIDSTTPFVQDLPTTEDGKIYIFLGVAYSTTAMELLLNHPVYYYSNGCIRQWTNSNKTEQTYNGNSSMSQTSYTNSIVNGNTAEFSCTSGSNKAFIQATYDDSGECPVIILGGYTSTNGNKNSLFVDPSGEITIHNLSAPVQNTDAATKGYVDTAIGAISAPVPATANPLMDGTAAVGTSIKYAREDHVHPKATYTASEVGLGNVDNVQQYSASNPPPYPVTSVNGETGAVNLSIPTKTSDLTNDAGFITGMTILSYGNSTWDNFITAYNANKVVYCRASSNSNPASGSQTRLAFMAYVNDATTPTNVEFQYYRSVSSHTESQQGDQVFVYKLDKSSGWSVTTREASVKVAYSNGITGTYSNGVMTLKHANTAITAQTTQGLYPITIDAYGHITGYGSAVTIPSIPSVTSSDNGKVLTVVDGAWAAANLPIYDGSVT